MDTGYSKWRKLDNAALAFPAVTGKNDTRVFRFYCELKEEIKEIFYPEYTGGCMAVLSPVLQPL